LSWDRGLGGWQKGSNADRGPESELGATYDKLYGKWMHEHGRRPAGFDFEVWDERFQPEEPNSEFDLFVALAGD
jgi:AraC family transcriptional regulator